MVCVFHSVSDKRPWPLNRAIIVLHTVEYSRKYWRELNLAVEPKIAITRILVYLSLAGIKFGG